MRFRTAVVLGVLISTAAAAQPSEDAKSPSGQILMKRLAGKKNQNSSSDKGSLGETKEQHDHYLKSSVQNQPITNNTTNNFDDNE